MGADRGEGRSAPWQPRRLRELLAQRLRGFSNLCRSEKTACQSPSPTIPSTWRGTVEPSQKIELARARRFEGVLAAIVRGGV